MVTEVFMVGPNLFIRKGIERENLMIDTNLPGQPAGGFNLSGGT
jgi:hypothetical protein